MGVSMPPVPHTPFMSCTVTNLPSDFGRTIYVYDADKCTQNFTGEVFLETSTFAYRQTIKETIC